MEIPNHAAPMKFEALTAAEEKEVMKMSAVGLMPFEIALSMEWSPERRAAFCRLAMIPGSVVATLMLEGRTLGKTQPQVKLQEAAAAGNIEAVKSLQELQAKNRMNELITFMDEDETPG